MTSPEKAGPSAALIPRAHAYGSSWSEMIKLLSKRELSSQLVSTEVVLPDLENSLLAGTKIAGR